MDIINMSPFFKEEIWGGSKMRSEFGYDIPSDKTGECWAVSAHPNGPGRVADGEYKGMLLSELWDRHRELFGNLKGDRFPLLTKIIDANDKLSVQVHPDDDYAAINEHGSLGKMECWYVLDAEPGAKLIIGHNATSKEELREMIHDGKWDKLLREIPVKKGDFIQINPGTIHAIKNGIMILETQQNSDITYRLYDYDRKKNGVPRELHIEKSLDVIKVPFVNEKTEPCKTEGWITKLYECKYYRVWKGTLRKDEILKTDQPFLIGSLIEGTACINGRKYCKGSHFIIPSGMGELKFSGNADFIFSAPYC
ncbi:MAG: mannose-6-phosphate isomerase, class I [Eubacterium sp.]|nr:mannose-6-phosphate isomerase, class I [Eubacterium sp.]